MRNIVAVIGDSNIENDKVKQEMAFETGRLLVDNGYRVKSGGMRGVMLYAFKGAKSSKKYREGDTIAILPGFDISTANDYTDIVIPTGIDLMRNVIVANSHAVVAVGGGSGTLSEMASAWALKRLIVSYKNVDGWSKKLADQKIDSRDRFPGLEDKVWGVDSPEQMIKIINNKIKIYQNVYEGIKP